MSYVSGHYRKGHFRNGKWVSGGYVNSHYRSGIGYSSGLYSANTAKIDSAAKTNPLKVKEWEELTIKGTGH